MFQNKEVKPDLVIPVQETEDVQENIEVKVKNETGLEKYIPKIQTHRFYEPESRKFNILTKGTLAGDDLGNESTMKKLELTINVYESDEQEQKPVLITKNVDEPTRQYHDFLSIKCSTRVLLCVLAIFSFVILLRMV